MAEIIVSVKGFKCERCSYEWIPRKKELPVICAKCKSPYWNRPRKNQVKKKSNKRKRIRR